MKLVKMKLADGKTYTFSTFTLLEQKVMKKEHGRYEDLQEEMEKIRFQTDKDGNLIKDDMKDVILRENLTKEQKVRLQEIEDEIFDFMIDVLRKSVARNHPEFKKQEDPNKEKEIRETLMGLIDTSDLKKITNFAFTGTYLTDEKYIIDLTEDEEGEKK